MSEKFLPPMKEGKALTFSIKQELAAKEVYSNFEKKFEVITFFRLLGSLKIVSKKLVLEVGFDNRETAIRFTNFIYDLYEISAELLELVPSKNKIKNKKCFVVRIIDPEGKLARQLGLLGKDGLPIIGFPVSVTSRSEDEIRAIIRAAFLAHGSLARPNRSVALEITCHNIEIALTIVAALKRFGIQPKIREVKNGSRIVIRDGDEISSILEEMGAGQTREIWEKFKNQRKVNGEINRISNFDDANLKRSVNAATVNSSRIVRAFEILGDNVPDHLYEIGKLRVEHKDLSLDELGKLLDPPITKDATAGRIRRLIEMADKEAHKRSIPDTTESIEG